MPALPANVGALLSSEVEVGDKVQFAGWTWRITRFDGNVVLGVGLDTPKTSGAEERRLFQRFYGKEVLHVRRASG